MKVNYIVVGQGLAGSIVAWELMRRECKVLVVDNEKTNAASRVAAGLINPITGQRLVKSAQTDTCLPFALEYYRQLEKTFQTAFYHALPMLRLFRTKADRDRSKSRVNDQHYQPYFGEVFASGESGEPVNDSHGGIEQRQAGYLNISLLLHTLKDVFKNQSAYVSAPFDYQGLIINDETVQWKDYQAEYVIFCDGANAIDNPWFRWLPFQLSKGEIITIQSDSPVPEKIINDGHWLVPLQKCKAKVGATFSWEWLDEKPSLEAHQQLLESCERLLGSRDTISVIEHDAGIRPTTKDKQPFIGIHPMYQRMAIFNGFGAKGSMVIPYCASKLIAHLMSGEAIPAEVDIARFESGKSLTTLAKRYLSSAINSGDVVIDATVGNGFDTEFLARCVGPKGQVIGFDIQQDAIAATQHKLTTTQLSDRVMLYQVNHEEMSTYVDQSLHGQIAAISFNLGYLPGSVKTVKTDSASTLNALDQAIALIKPGGVITVIAYPGHQGGQGELENIKNRLLVANETQLDVKFICPDHSSGRSPELMIISKSKSAN